MLHIAVILHVGYSTFSKYFYVISVKFCYSEVVFITFIMNRIWHRSNYDWILFL